MLDFYLIRDEQPNNTASRQLAYAGGIEWEKFEKAQTLKIIESHLDYYGKLRWLTQNVKQKQIVLIPAVIVVIPNLASILKQAITAGCGLAAFGD